MHTVTKTTLSWNDRFAIINHYHPSDKDITKVFGVSQKELEVARNMEHTGSIIPTSNLNVESYAKLFNEKSESTGYTSHERTPMKPAQVTPPTPAMPTTATKISKKRGRKGNKITTAFVGLPNTPTPLAKYAAKCGVSTAVLKQSKRFDKSDCGGKVKVKMDKSTNELMIWRMETD